MEQYRSGELDEIYMHDVGDKRLQCEKVGLCLLQISPRLAQFCGGNHIHGIRSVSGNTTSCSLSAGREGIT